MNRSNKKPRSADSSSVSTKKNSTVQLPLPQTQPKRISFDSSSASSSNSSDSDQDDDDQTVSTQSVQINKKLTSPQTFVPLPIPQKSTSSGSSSSDTSNSSSGSDSSSGDDSSSDSDQDSAKIHDNDTQHPSNENEGAEAQDNKEKTFRFADLIPCDKGRPFLPETVEYFNTMTNMMKDLPKIAPEERSILLRTFFNETRGWEYRVLTRPTYTKLMGDCLAYATPSQIKQLWVGCIGRFGNLFLHQYTAMTMQQLLVRVAEVLHAEHVNNTIFAIPTEDHDSDEEDGDSDEETETKEETDKAKKNPSLPMLELFINMTEEIRPHWPVLMSNMHSSFITRTIILVILGCTQITSTMIKEGTATPSNTKSHSYELKQISLLKSSQQLHERITQNPGLENIDQLAIQNTKDIREQKSLPSSHLQANQLMSRAHVKGTETILEDLVTVVRLQTTKCEENEYTQNWDVHDMCIDTSLSPVLLCLLHALSYLRTNSPTPPLNPALSTRPVEQYNAQYYHELLDIILLTVLQWRYVGKSNSYIIYSHFNTTSPLSAHNYKNGPSSAHFLESEGISSTSAILGLYQLQSQAQAIFTSLVSHPIGSRLLERIIGTSGHLVTTNIYFKYIRRTLTHFCVDRFANHIIQAIVVQLPYQFDIFYNIVKDILELDDTSTNATQTAGASSDSSDTEAEKQDEPETKEESSEPTTTHSTKGKKIETIPLPIPTTSLSATLLASKVNKEENTQYESNTFYSIVKAKNFGIFYQLAVALQVSSSNLRHASIIANSPIILKVQQTVLKAFQEALGKNNRQYSFLLNLCQLRFFPWLITYPTSQRNTVPDMQHLGVMTVVAMLSWAVPPAQIMYGFQTLMEGIPKPITTKAATPYVPREAANTNTSNYNKNDKSSKFGKYSKENKETAPQIVPATKFDVKTQDFPLLSIIKSPRGAVLIEYYINSSRIDFKTRVAFVQALAGYYTAMVMTSPSASHLVQSMYFLPFPSKVGINDQQYERIMLEIRTSIMREITESSNAKKIRSTNHGPFLLSALHFEHYLSQRSPWTPTAVSKKLQRNIHLFSDLLSNENKSKNQGPVKRKAETQLQFDDEL